jgi:hypothetical protein
MNRVVSQGRERSWVMMAFEVSADHSGVKALYTRKTSSCRCVGFPATRSIWGIDDILKEQYQSSTDINLLVNMLQN